MKEELLNIIERLTRIETNLANHLSVHENADKKSSKTWVIIFGFFLTILQAIILSKIL